MPDPSGRPQELSSGDGVAFVGKADAQLANIQTHVELC